MRACFLSHHSVSHRIPSLKAALSDPTDQGGVVSKFYYGTAGMCGSRVMCVFCIQKKADHTDLWRASAECRGWRSLLPTIPVKPWGSFWLFLNSFLLFFFFFNDSLKLSASQQMPLRQLSGSGKVHPSSYSCAEVWNQMPAYCNTLRYEHYPFQDQTRDS